MNVTINDIARATGLSTATISKYINHKKIREENRILIERAIQELGYTPNRNAQLLRAKNTHTIGILISDLGNYFWGELVNSIIKHFTDHGYTVIVCSFFFEHQKEIDTIQDIISQHFAGVIMLPSCWHDDLYRLLQNAGIPVVMLDQIPASMRHFPVDCVISDNYKGGALLAEHLLEKGHTKVWIMEQYLDAYTIEQRIQGFVDVYQKNGIDLLKQQDSFPPVSFGSTAETVIQSNLHFQKLIDSSDPPTAVFFDCYLSAMGGLSAASQARISVPQDISFVCFDDDPLFKTMSAAMTCVSQDLTSIGKHAVELLLKRIHGNNYSARLEKRGLSKNRHAGCCIPPATLCKRPVRAQQYNIRKGLIYECNHQGHCQRNWPGTGHHFKIYQRRNCTAAKQKADRRSDPETELRSTKHGPGTSFLQDLPYRSGIRSSQYSA